MFQLLKIWALVALFSAPSFAQYGGAKSLTDTLTLAQKFHVYALGDGQRLSVKQVTSDSTISADYFLTPLKETNPTCDAGMKGALVTQTSDNRVYFCNGTSWIKLVFDRDGDGLTDQLDANDASPFTSGSAAAGHVQSGYTFYTGAGMTHTTGTLAVVGAQYVTPNTGNQTIFSGIHNGSGIVYGDADLISNNIASGVNIHGVVGNVLTPPQGCGVGAGASPYTSGAGGYDHCDNDHDGSVDEWDSGNSATNPSRIGLFLWDDTTSKNRVCSEAYGGSYVSTPLGTGWGDCAKWTGSWVATGTWYQCLWGNGASDIVCTNPALNGRN